MIQSGKVQNDLKKQQDEIFTSIRDKKVSLLGVNQFVNESEELKINKFASRPYQSFLENKLEFYKNSIEQINQDRAALFFEREKK